MLEIRVYYQRNNMDPDYYTGEDEIRHRWKAKTPEELLLKWEAHLGKYEGETYSVWDGNNLVVGGAYDPGDDKFIRDYFGMKPE